ncbi:glycosaminoglycan xylosylkinase-like [Diadema antillarum]|uniref:glycosaminoglycan xylosylkinase-like n=1 Tax=Diadema antillarum TaxID=105358 RepID=UPI003A869B78
MRLKVKWVILLSILIVSLWLLVIVVLPSPPSTSTRERNSREQRQPGVDDALQNVDNRSIRRPGVESNVEHVEGKPALPNGGEDIVDIGNDKESEEALGEKEVPHEVEIENGQGAPQNGPNALDKFQNDTHPLEQDLVPLWKPRTRYEYSAIWGKAGQWVSSDQITPAAARELGTILHAMAHAPITRADVGFKGTQLKARLTLEGGQLVVFKPKRYPREHVIYGTPYAGYDRHNGEIAAFHLDRVLDFRRAPIVVGRVVNLRTEILPVASPVLKETFMEQNDNLCFYGKCYYCKPDYAACGDGDLMEGSLTLWLPSDLKLKKWRHLWSRTYKDGKKAKWETDDHYCVDLLKRVPPDRHPLLLHMTDAAVFDYLIGNADRHMYETFEKDGDRAMLLHMDNAKSFGNPYLDEGTILAPIYQCCRLRRSTWTTLQQYKDGRLSHVMSQVLQHDPIAPVLTNWHLEALDRRLNDIIDTVHNCFTKHGEDVVLVD